MPTPAKPINKFGQNFPNLQRQFNLPLQCAVLNIQFTSNYTREWDWSGLKYTDILRNQNHCQKFIWNELILAGNCMENSTQRIFPTVNRQFPLAGNYFRTGLRQSAIQFNEAYPYLCLYKTWSQLLRFYRMNFIPLRFVTRWMENC